LLLCSANPEVIVLEKEADQLPSTLDTGWKALEAYATLLFGLAREYGNHPAQKA
jgi:hypothetical protein